MAKMEWNGFPSGILTIFICFSQVTDQVSDSSRNTRTFLTIHDLEIHTLLLRGELMWFLPSFTAEHIYHSCGVRNQRINTINLRWGQRTNNRDKTNKGHLVYHRHSDSYILFVSAKIIKLKRRNENCIEENQIINEHKEGESIPLCRFYTYTRVRKVKPTKNRKISLYFGLFISFYFIVIGVFWKPCHAINQTNTYLPYLKR